MSQRSPTSIECTNYAEAFILHNDRTKAFKCAFPKSKASPHALNVAANKFHGLPEVRLRISELRESMQENAKEKAIYTLEDKQRWLVNIITYGMQEEGVPQHPDDMSDPELRQRHPSSAVAGIKVLNEMDGDNAVVKSKIDVQAEVVTVEMDENEFIEARKKALLDDDC